MALSWQTVGGGWGLSQTRSTNAASSAFHSVIQQTEAQAPGPFLVLAGGKSGSDDECLKSPTHSKRSGIYPSPLSTYCVLGTSHRPVWPVRGTGSHQEIIVKTRKLLETANALRAYSMGLGVPALSHRVPVATLSGRTVTIPDTQSGARRPRLTTRISTRFNISHI